MLHLKWRKWFYVLLVPRLAVTAAGMFSPEQNRAARALLGWSRDRLADESGVSAIAIKAFESGGNDPRVSTLVAIRTAFARSNVIFLDPTEERGSGVAFGLRGVP